MDVRCGSRSPNIGMLTGAEALGGGEAGVLRQVLVIEDDRDIAELVKIHVEELNCRVTLAHDGVAGLAQAESGSFHLVILDLMLPGLDGLEITRRLRAKTDPHSPPRYRTNGVVSNMPEFQEAFHCKPQSAMVNQNRCRVW